MAVQQIIKLHLNCKEKDFNKPSPICRTKKTVNYENELLSDLTTAHSRLTSETLPKALTLLNNSSSILKIANKNCI